MFSSGISLSRIDRWTGWFYGEELEVRALHRLISKVRLLLFLAKLTALKFSL